MFNRSLASTSRWHSPTRIYTLWLATASLLLLSGCTPVKVKLGMKVYLANTPVASMQASLPQGPGIAPGEKSPLVVVLTGPDGKVLQTEGSGHGKVLWKDLSLITTVVAANSKGILSLPHDPRRSEGKVAHVTITVPSHPDLQAELDIPIRYNYPFVADFSGGRGISGSSGMDGSNGTSGSMGSLDPNNPSAGGDGSNGGNGSDGQDGGRGGDAPSVRVRMTIRPGDRLLLEFSVSANSKEKFYLVDPQGGSLTVRADGGAGGSGGQGGRGGRGGSGGMGSPSGHDGSNGSDGRSGFDGPHGRGGNITVTYDPQAKPYLSALRLSNVGGPSPVFNEQPVPALW